ncbi:MAG: fimbrillin family protein [Bacteroidales bacterium]|nr:fimbrillin family protein [Bacteroidales bacterium]
MSFSNATTRALLSTTYSSFKVWATTVSGESQTSLMDGYRVNYLGGWTYTEGDGTDGQELQYWSYSIDSYRFHAGAPALRVTAGTATSLTLSLTSSASLGETTLYSEPYVVKNTDAAFGSTVSLKFNYANARINLAFKYASAGEVSITDIQLVPPAALATAATLAVSYNWVLPSVKTGTPGITATSTDPLIFANVTVPADSGDAVETSTPHYVIADPASKGQWTLKVKVNGTDKQTTFSLSKAWEPGKSYLYRFAYTDEANLVFEGTETELFTGDDPVDGGNHNFS